VAAYCVLRLRGRVPDHHRPFRVPLVRVVAISGLVIFSVLALVASVSVGNRFDPVPLIIILAMGAASALYTVRVVPGLQPQPTASRPAAAPSRP